MESSLISILDGGFGPLPVLLAQSDPKLLNGFPQILKATFPNLSVDLCTSRDHAVSKLASGSYHAIIANANLAVMDNCSLLKHYQSIRPHTPLLVSIGPYEHSLARQALQAGAFDVLVNPVDTKQTLDIVQPALWLYQLRITIHRRQKTVREYQQQRLAASDMSAAHKQIFERIHLDLEQTYSRMQQSIDAIEASLRYLTDAALAIETEARQRCYRAFGLPLP